MSCDDDTDSPGAYAYWTVSGLSYLLFQAYHIARSKYPRRAKILLGLRWLISIAGCTASSVIVYESSGLVEGFWPILLGLFSVYSGFVLTLVLTPGHRARSKSVPFYVCFAFHLAGCIVLGILSFSDKTGAGIASLLPIGACIYEVVDILGLAKYAKAISFKSTRSFVNE